MISIHFDVGYSFHSFRDKSFGNNKTLGSMYSTSFSSKLHVYCFVAVIFQLLHKPCFRMMLDVPSSTIFVCYMCLLILGILLYICLNLFLTYPMFSAFRLHFRVTSIAKSCNFEVSNFCCY